MAHCEDTDRQAWEITDRDGRTFITSLAEGYRQAPGYTVREVRGHDHTTGFHVTERPEEGEPSVTRAARAVVKAWEDTRPDSALALAAALDELSATLARD